METVKGFRNIFPPESLKRKKIMGVIEEQFRAYGFLPIETPSIEFDKLLTSESEETAAVSDRFRLRDRGGRKLGLRYEFTVQLSRIFKENPNIKLPFRRYQIGSVFRDEALKPGKYKEFVQADGDIIGDSSINADAECVAVANSVLSELNIKAEIVVNNKKLLNSILSNAGVKSNNQQVLREIDKLDKLSEKEVKGNLSKILKKDQIKKIFILIKRDLGYFLKNKFEGAEEIKELQDLGKIYGYKIKFMPNIVRGFGYYTGNIWEIWAKDMDIALGGGGRYDEKVGKYVNRKLPAVGISFGKLLDYPNVESAEGIKVVLISIGKDKDSLKILKDLRKNQISSLMFSGKISKSLDYANSYKVPYVLFLGKDEVKKKKVKLRDMKTGKEKLVAVNNLKSLLR